MFVFRVCRPFLLLLFVSLLFFCSVFFNSVQAAGWLELPDQSISLTSDIADEPVNRSVSSGKGQQLIQWLGTASQHGISLPEQNWLQLAADPSPRNIRVIARQFAVALDAGMLDKRVYQPGWRISDQPVLASLENHLDNDNLSLVEPALPEYKLLKQHLKQLRWWLDNALQQFPDDRVLEKGDRHASIWQLNQWLKDLDLADGLPANVYSGRHQSAVSKIQKRFRLTVDGKLGPRTRQALIAMTLERIKTLRINLERLRWLPRTLPYPRVWVDIAGFRVFWMTGRYQQQKFKAIVGLPSRQTPVFQDEIESITINPPWRVPASIASTSLLRKAKQDSSFLEREGFTVYSGWESNAREVNPDKVNWRSLSRQSFPYRLEQKPGKVNRLGRYKLDSPNRFSVYLHDTHKPELFNKTVRTFSSGCTRVENIDELINSILASQGMTSRVRALQQLGDTSRLKLHKKVPLYFAYFTAWPEKNGRVRFREDIYRLDDALLAKF
ncbi:L,D-transpeptidase family protein [Endozoicomonas euniceicola]|uniref:L,D-transpeptidase family protein n=1 Tax=Endozoicomonas euniceicola TaxID=1234143 RepID=A0ABY6GVE7_9GAMM|nr:L,D-transpeptidase family protein [Endozoicomonas euniceicola]UYM16650.1 L,D-transpeptidase family protein [Endozoicomonas euniceicola]